MKIGLRRGPPCWLMELLWEVGWVPKFLGLPGRYNLKVMELSDE